VQVGNTLWLVGMMGAGKSAVGRALAEKLGVVFVDSDREVETAAGRSVADIFADEGEAAFRARERRIVERLAGSENVVALGGGTIAQPGMAQRLADTGTVIYLRAKSATLVARLEGCGDRPLLAGMDAAARGARLDELLAERREAYETASIVVDTDGAAIPEVVREVMRRLPQDRSRATNEGRE